MKNYSKYLYWTLLAINIAFAIYFVSSWIFFRPTAQPLPVRLLVQNDLIRAEVFNLSEKLENKQIVMALMSSKASVCAINNVVDVFRAARINRPNVKLSILFPENMSDSDVLTFKDNFKLDFEVARMNSKLNEYWGQISQEYETPAIIIVGDQNNIFASQSLTEIKRAIDLF